MSETVQVVAGGVRWLVAAECRERLLGPDGLRLAEWLRAGRAEVVKQAPHRTIYRVTLPGLHFYLKHYPLADARAWLRQLVRPGKARTEYDRARAAARRGIPTVTPLAVGERGGGLTPGDSFLVTRSLDGHEPLNAFIETTFPNLPAARQARVRQRLAVELGRLLARVHAAGLTHHDLHAGNLLVRLTAGDVPVLHVIDLSAARLGRPLAWRARRANLVVLNRWFVLRVGRADRLRFWHAYCREWRNGERAKGRKGETAKRGWLRSPFRPFADSPIRCFAVSQMARDLERRTWDSNRRFWKNRDRCCLARNRYYRPVRSAAAAGHAVTDLDAAALAALLADPDAPFQRPGVKLLKDSRSSTVAELEMVVGGRLRRVVYKRFRVTTWRAPWATLLRPPPALRSWVYGQGLRERGLPTPRPLAVFHRRRLGLPREGYLLTEKLEGASDLRAFLAGLDRLPPAERRARLRRRVEQLAHLVRGLHRRRLSHRDLKAANVLVTDEETGPPAEDRRDARLLPLSAARFPGLWLIDLVGVASPRRLPWRRRVQNLARLHASFAQNPRLTRTDKLRFLRAYLQWNLFGRSGWKRWWRAVAAATALKVARNRRRGRPLA